MNDQNLNPNEPRDGSAEASGESLSEYAIDPGPAARKFLGVEPILARRIIRLGVPVIIGMLTQTAINIIDGLMVGRLPDEAAVIGTAAIGPSLILLWAFGGFLSAISVGTQAMTARRIGEGEIKSRESTHEFFNGRRDIKHRRDLFCTLHCPSYFQFYQRRYCSSGSRYDLQPDKIRRNFVDGTHGFLQEFLRRVRSGSCAYDRCHFYEYLECLPQLLFHFRV